MKPYQIIRVFQILAVVMTLIFPFTGVIALSKAIQAKSALNVDKQTSDKYLSDAYKWIMTSLFAFIIIYAFLLFILGFIYLSK